MFKEALQDIITERFLDDKISAEKFENLIEKTSVISESRAFELLGEIQFGSGVITEGWKQALKKSNKE